MFLRAYPYNKDVIFYFDRFNNKHIAKGGNLCWRLNNPGLVHSHTGAAFRNGSIGSFQKYAIFPNSALGERALIEWLYCKKYFNSSLLKVAKHYQPHNSKGFSDRLCALTSLGPDAQPCSLNKKEFHTLIWGLKKLTGFSSVGDEELYTLPKISGRFHSNETNIKLYLVETNQFLTKSEAIHWVETHRLDAVVVHKENGDVHLRSRSGHHFKKIHLTEAEYGRNIKFKDIVRDTGERKKGQCTWGFINGIKNPPSSTKTSMELISALVDHQQVWSLINDEKLWGIGDLSVCFFLKLNLKTPIVKLATNFLHFLLNQSNHSPVVVIAHSQGALISDLALTNLSLQERKRIHIFTFGGAAYIEPGKTHKNSHNFVNLHDPIPRLASPNLSYILLRREECYRQGNGDNELLEQLLAEDADLYLDTQNPRIVAEYKKQRRKHYREQLNRLKNVTALEGDNSGSWEHSFDIPCYQSKLKEILESYNK